MYVFFMCGIPLLMVFFVVFSASFKAFFSILVISFSIEPIVALYATVFASKKSSLVSFEKFEV